VKVLKFGGTSVANAEKAGELATEKNDDYLKVFKHISDRHQKTIQGIN